MGADTKVSDKQISEKTKALMGQAVHKHSATSRQGLLERLFTLAFQGFVYPQIWEDPEVDLSALELDEDSRVMTIASGGCNVMNYLTESPACVKAVDLNPAQVSLARLKLAALKHLPDYESFFLFFGHADDRRNVENYERYIAPHLDPFSRRYWEGFSLLDGRRVNYFTKNIYQFGLLGRLIALLHLFAWLNRKDPRAILEARTLAEQREVFERAIGPIFDTRLVKRLCSMPVALYGIGIPPAQFHELSRSVGGDMAGLVKARVEQLACGHPIEDNYFAWQAFARGYDRVNRRAVPRYLREEHYEELKRHADRVEVHHASMTSFLASQPEASLDRYVFLDAQDWMSGSQLNILWSEVLRTARPGARVIFRTAGVDSPLTSALAPELLGRWDYDATCCRAMAARDRSSMYGGFHVYTLRGGARSR